MRDVLKKLSGFDSDKIIIMTLDLENMSEGRPYVRAPMLHRHRDSHFVICNDTLIYQDAGISFGVEDRVMKK
jgi:hypothetical protein